MLKQTLIPQGTKLIRSLANAQAIPPRRGTELEREMALSEDPPADFLVYQRSFERDVILQHWSEILGVESTELNEGTIDPEATRDVPETVARALRLIPVSRRDRWLTVCMADPLDVDAIDRVRQLTGLEVLPKVALAREIDEAIHRFYSTAATMQAAFREAEQDRSFHLPGEGDEGSDEVVIAESTTASAECAPVVRIVNLLLAQALKDRASDIHIEPDDDVVRVRFRVDGILQEKTHPPRALFPAIVTRVKVLCGMDIAEKRQPQDGQFSVRYHDVQIDLRVSTLPTVKGEKIVIRLLDRRSILVGLDRSGMADAVREHWRRLIHASGGIVLVTGPTGSGKTTTLYSSLMEINDLERNIVTVEDPVEYKLPIVAQVQTNARTGVTFAAGLRAILRQDPDVILVGEIRDRETADIAIRSALTGHLVFSTLHTTEAAGTLVRLTDMGLEPYLVASSVRAILAQRLVRCLCAHCRVEAEPEPLMLKALGLTAPQGPLYRGRGCRHCRNSGYFGRTGIYELLAVTDAVRDLIIARADTRRLRELAMQEGMVRLRDEGLGKVYSGATSLAEVARVASDED